MLTDNAPGSSGWVECHCCARSFPAENLVTFYRHPGDAICITCIEWLRGRGRPIGRRLNPVWQLPARMRTRVKGARWPVSRAQRASRP